MVAGSLGGLTTDSAPQVASTLEEFARLVDEENPAEEAASLRKAGFVARSRSTAQATAGTLASRA